MNKIIFFGIMILASLIVSITINADILSEINTIDENWNITKTVDSFNSLDIVMKDVNKTSVTLYYWNREGSIDISIPEFMSEKPTKLDKNTLGDGSIIQTVLGGTLVKYYILENQSNMFEYEIELEKYPKLNGNVFTFLIENYSDLNFYYQPPLYEEAGLLTPNATCNATDCNGAHRPENIVSSYAVYGNKQGNNYMNGKIFDIYRPKAIASDGSWIWGDLNFVNGNLTVTIDNDWLLKAKYPVIIDPTFGYTTAGANSIGSTANMMWGWIAEPIIGAYSTYEIDNCSVYTRSSTFGVTFYTKVVIVLNSSKTIVTNGISEPTVTTKNTAVSWKTFTFATKPIIDNNTRYIPMFIPDTTSTSVYFYYTSNATSKYHMSGDNNYTSPTDPTNGVYQTTYMWSAYCSYTGIASPPPDTTAPTVTLNNVSFETTDTTPDVYFHYTDASATANCTLYFNATAKANNPTVANNTVTALTSSALSVGSYTVFVGCKDLAGNLGNSSAITVNITTAITDSCTCPQNAGTNYAVNLSDHCVLTGNCLCANLTFIDSGNFSFSNGIFNYSSINLNGLSNTRFYGSNTLWKKR